MSQRRKRSRSERRDSIKKILRPGKQLTDNNIDQILAVNNDKMNVELVKELVKNLKLRNVDSRGRSQALCDVQNVCNIIMHLQNKAANESK